MSLSSIVAPHLPYLRRYARALTGSQAGGDAYVAALLEKVIANPGQLTAAGGDAKTELYRALSTLWGSVTIENPSDRGVAAWEAAARDRLSAIPGKARQAFLLRNVEGFDREKTAAIIEVSPEQGDQLYEDANRQISAMLASRVMIIEDEPLIAMDIEDIVSALGHTVAGVARTQREAVALASRSQPELILSDIQLADGSSGIDAVNDILHQFTVPVIFVTAFPERLLTGNKPEPAFLITKPFSPDMVKTLIAQAIFFSRPDHLHPQM